LKDRASEAVSLRRFDWRFLLPLPPKGRFEHLVVLGTPTSAAARLKELNLSDRLSVNPNVSAEADAVVVLAGAAVPPSAVAAFVQPGGLVYWEIDRRASLAWTPGRLRRAMRNVGLFATSTYWVVPHHAAPRKFVPLDCAAAIRWYFDTSFVAGSPRLRLLRAIMRVLGTFQGGIDRFVPCYSMVATAGPVPAARPRALAAPGVPPAIAAEDVRPVVLTSGRDDGSRVVVLPFAQGRAEPSAVLKLARDSAFSEHTMREQMTLGYLRERLSPTMKSTLPAALGMKTSADSDASPVAVESYASGSSLQVSTAQWGASSTRRLADLHRASDWITRFHEETVLSRAPWGPEQQGEWIERRFAAYRDVLGLTRAEHTLFSSAIDYGRRLRGRLPIVYRHNDFGPWNVVRHGDRLTVIDWESRDETEGERYGLPLCDLIYFVTYWYAAARRMNAPNAEVQAFVDLFLRREFRSALRSAVLNEIANYLRRLQIAREFMPLILVHSMVDRAVDQARRLQILESVTGDSARSANRFVPFVECLCRNRDRLFPD